MHASFRYRRGRTWIQWWKVISLQLRSSKLMDTDQRLWNTHSFRWSHCLNFTVCLSPFNKISFVLTWPRPRVIKSRRKIKIWARCLRLHRRLLFRLYSSFQCVTQLAFKCQRGVSSVRKSSGRNAMLFVCPFSALILVAYKKAKRKESKSRYALSDRSDSVFSL